MFIALYVIIYGDPNAPGFFNVVSHLAPDPMYEDIGQKEVRQQGAVSVGAAVIR